MSKRKGSGLGTDADDQADPERISDLSEISASMRGHSRDDTPSAKGTVYSESEKLPGKRPRGSEDLELDDPTPEDLSKMSRSERKRHREKKRRNDVNKGFDELMSLLLEIDPDVRAEVEEKSRRGQFKGVLAASEDNLLSRVDLISRAVDVLRRLHRENEERKLIIAALLEESSPKAATGAAKREMPVATQFQGSESTLASLESTSAAAVAQFQLNQNLRGRLGLLSPSTAQLLDRHPLFRQLHTSTSSNTNPSSSIQWPFPGTDISTIAHSRLQDQHASGAHDVAWATLQNLSRSPVSGPSSQYLQLLQNQQAAQLLASQLSEIRRTNEDELDAQLRELREKFR